MWGTLCFVIHVFSTTVKLSNSSIYFLNLSFKMNIISVEGVKLWFTTMCFVGFNSLPNLMVILFNLLYLVFIVGFDCKGCVIEWECEDSSNWRLKSFRGYLATKHPAKWLIWLAYAGMRRVRTRWRQLCLASILRVRPSCETPTRHSSLPDCQFWYTLSVPTLFIPILPTNVKECFWEKTLANHLES